jgi:hypothetical protein
LSLYNRALSSNEISAIYIAGSAGKCFTPAPPTIVSQPTNQTTTLGGTASFTVTAGGTLPLSYQWSLNMTNIAGATNATLLLANVQLNQAGNYAVLVSNVAGSVSSSNAVLTVNLPPPCDPAPAGLVSWWRAENNAYDSIGTNNGSPTGGITYTNGEVGQAFVFNGSTSYIPVPASPGLNIGTGSGLTIECWIQPNAAFNANVSGAPIIEWDSATTDGLQLWAQGALAVNIKDTSGNAHKFQTANGMLTTNNFQHVALTYDKSSGNAVIYYNGVPVTNVNFGSITAQTTYPVNIGRRTGQPIGRGDTYGGLLDELSLYNRALSSNEISAIYIAGSAGKCPLLPPSIISQPTNQTVFVGGTAIFNVAATGSLPLSYQWRFIGTNLSGATNNSLTLTNVQLNQAGNYAVLVTNAYGSILSSNVVLTVNPLHHFDWNSIPSPRVANVPFVVTILAKDPADGTVTNFTGTVLFGSTNGVAVNPPVSGSFVQGAWTGSVVIPQITPNLVLRADDGLGHFGLANPINIIGLPSLDLRHSGNTLLILWPVGASGFVLETSSGLLPGTWIVVPDSPFQIGDQFVVPVVMSDTNRFYRLQFSVP